MANSTNGWSKVKEAKEVQVVNKRGRGWPTHCWYPYSHTAMYLNFLLLVEIALVVEMVAGKMLVRVTRGHNPRCIKLL